MYTEMRPLPRARRLWRHLPLLTLCRAMTFNVSLRSSRNAKHFAKRLNKPRTRRGFRRAFIKFDRWERDVKAINRYLVVLEENFCRVFPGEKIRVVRVANWKAIPWPLYPVVRVRCASLADEGWGQNPRGRSYETKTPRNNEAKSREHVVTGV